jgi:hypothetical protein
VLGFLMGFDHLEDLETLLEERNIWPEMHGESMAKNGSRELLASLKLRLKLATSLDLRHESPDNCDMIPLPPQAGAIPLPPAPQDPPVLADVVRAKHYKRSVEEAIGELCLLVL